MVTVSRVHKQACLTRVVHADGNMVALRVAVDKNGVHRKLRALFAQYFLLDAREIIHNPAGRAICNAAHFHAGIVKGHKFASDAVIVENMTANREVFGFVAGEPENVTFLVVVVL